MELKVKIFRQEMVSFFTKNGRKDLPWRNTSDPWKLLLAEVLLRKSTSKQASCTYLELQEMSPYDIMNIPLDDLKNILSPMGMSNIKSVQLKYIAAAYSKANEDDICSDKFLESLPGIGRYISNMVKCCAFEMPLPGLDTNMIRILQRFFGYEPYTARARDDKRFWKFAETLVAKDFPKEYNWGIMDFGAAICTKRKPNCNICRLNQHCDYFQQQR